MCELFANPYDTTNLGFFFSSYEEYKIKSSNLVDDFGYPVEEFEIEFIDGDLCQLFNACDINQCNLELWFEGIELLPESDQVELFYRCEHLSQDTQEAFDNINNDGFVQQSTLIDYAYDYVNDYGVLDCLPEMFKSYFDYEAYARDLELNGEVIEFTYDNSTYIASAFYS